MRPLIGAKDGTTGKPWKYVVRYDPRDMSRVFLFECSPRRPSDGVAVVQRYCFSAPGPANYLGKQWEPVISDMPEFSSGIGFDGRQFAAAPEPQKPAPAAPSSAPSAPSAPKAPGAPAAPSAPKNTQ